MVRNQKKLKKWVKRLEAGSANDKAGDVPLDHAVEQYRAKHGEWPLATISWAQRSATNPRNQFHVIDHTHVQSVLSWGLGLVNELPEAVAMFNGALLRNVYLVSVAGLSADGWIKHSEEAPFLRSLSAKRTRWCSPMHQRDALDAVLFLPPEVRLEHDAPKESKRSKRKPRFPPGDFAVPFPGLQGLSVPLPVLMDDETAASDERPTWRVTQGDRVRTWVGKQGFALSQTAAGDLWAAEEDDSTQPLCSMAAEAGRGPLGPWTSGEPRWPTLPLEGLAVEPRATSSSPLTIDLPEGTGLDELPLVLVGLDCEMVRTAAGLELARVSCVSPSGKVLLDSFVKPSRQVEDYLTRWSGVTASSLENVKTRLEDVQAAICHLLDARPGSFLVGHSLECDLAALRLYHTRILDTSLLYPHRDGPPKRSSLKFLSQHFLGRSVQADDAAAGAGHCSVEDARAAMDLALLKLSQGPGFGNLHGNPSLTLRGASILRAVEQRTEPDTAVRMVGSPDWLAVQADAPALLAERYPVDDGHSAEKTIGKLQELAESDSSDAHRSVSVARVTIRKTGSAHETDIRAVDSALRDLHKALPRYSLLVVVSQGTSPSSVSVRPPSESPLDAPPLQSQTQTQSRRKRPREETTSDDEAEPLGKRSAPASAEDAVQAEPMGEIRWGMSFLCVAGQREA